MWSGRGLMTMFTHYLPNILNVFESANNPYNPFHYMNSAIDMMFYDVSMLSAKEFNQAIWSPQPEGTILILQPGKTQPGYGVCVPQDTGLSAEQRAEAVVDQYDHFLASHGGICVDTIAVAGCGSSTVGAAAFGKAVAEILQRPVASIVTGGGVGDARGEILGGMMLGAASQLIHALDALIHTQLRNQERRDWMRQELEGFLKAVPEALTLRTMLGRSLFGNADLANPKSLNCVQRNACPLKTIVSHSKGDWIVWGALLGIEFLANRLDVDQIIIPPEGKRPHIDVITFGCLVDLPDMPQLADLRSIFHYHQFVGSADTMLGLTQSPYQKSFELFFKGMVDGFRPNYLADPDECLIPFKGHDLVAMNPLHMPMEDLLKACVEGHSTNQRMRQAA